jgi:seryl-tRNA synthetase
MLEINQIRTQTEAVVAGLERKYVADAATRINQILEADEQKRALQTQSDQLKSKVNGLSREIGEDMKSGRAAEAQAKKEEVARLKSEDSGCSDRLDQLEQALHQMLVQLPNLPHDLVPPGRTPDDNLEVHRWGSISPGGEGVLPHWELTKTHGLIDFEEGVKVTGAGFPVYKGAGARLQRALINFFLDRNTAAGYLEIQPPILVNEASGFGTGQLPDKEGQMYFVGEDKLYLAPTAEVPVTNLYRDTLWKSSDLPIKNTAYTPCFRREAGSYGKDVRGLNRLHQFDKVEIVQITLPEHSEQALNEMCRHVGSLIEALELPHRMIRLCGGDMSFASALTYDFEVWSRGQDRWLEVSSVSNFKTFQTNRLKVRYRDEEGKNQLAHSLNGSALALPRIVAALLEHHQTGNSIRIPAALVPYTGFDSIGGR